MLIDMLRDIEKRTEPAIVEKNPFSPTDKEVVQLLISRLRRNMCSRCPWAAQRGGIETLPAPEPAAQDAMALTDSRKGTPPTHPPEIALVVNPLFLGPFSVSP